VPPVSLRWSLLLVFALAAGACFAACSSSKASGRADGGAADASVDAEEDVSLDVATAPNDVVAYPDTTFTGPDGCSLPGATCLDDTTCCSAYCVDGGCGVMPVKQ
jgi:hypothetical protein